MWIKKSLDIKGTRLTTTDKPCDRTDAINKREL